MQKVHVPVWLCFALLIGYLCLGATMFSQWQDWTFVDAVYFCFTTLSTIGFGDLVPGFDGNVEDTENFARQFICVFSLRDLLLGLAVLAMIFELIKLSLFVRSEASQNGSTSPISVEINELKVKSAQCGIHGYGDIVPRTYGGRTATMFYATFGIPLALLCLANLGYSMASLVRKILFRLFVEDHAVDDDDDNQRVPMWICILCMYGYLCLGGWLFCRWEGWDYYEAFYFCFTTLSTIGFGDFVPGVGEEGGSASVQKQLVCLFYLLFGLALLAMNFELIRMSIVDICLCVAFCLGLVKDRKTAEEEYKKKATSEIAKKLEGRFTRKETSTTVAQAQTDQYSTRQNNQATKAAYLSPDQQHSSRRYAGDDASSYGAASQQTSVAQGKQAQVANQQEQQAAYIDPNSPWYYDYEAQEWKYNYNYDSPWYYDDETQQWKGQWNNCWAGERRDVGVVAHDMDQFRSYSTNVNLDP
nr:hypothetical protein BaRGS_016802 [Batillaria attramentaria]